MSTINSGTGNTGLGATEPLLQKQEVSSASSQAPVEMTALPHVRYTVDHGINEKLPDTGSQQDAVVKESTPGFVKHCFAKAFGATLGVGLGILGGLATGIGAALLYKFRDESEEKGFFSFVGRSAGQAFCGACKGVHDGILNAGTFSRDELQTKVYDYRQRVQGAHNQNIQVEVKDEKGEINKVYVKVEEDHIKKFRVGG